MVIAKRGGGPLYVLFLKRHLDANARLQRDDYVEIAQDTQETLIRDRKSTRLNSSHIQKSRMPSSA